MENIDQILESKSLEIVKISRSQILEINELKAAEIDEETDEAEVDTDEVPEEAVQPELENAIDQMKEVEEIDSGIFHWWFQPNLWRFLLENMEAGEEQQNQSEELVGSFLIWTRNLLYLKDLIKLRL